MTTVMSKLRDLSARTGIPLHYLTRTVSGTVLLLYGAKLTYPYWQRYFRQTIENAASTPANSPEKTPPPSPEKTADETDILVQIVASAKGKSPTERYLNFGPKRPSKILSKIEELLVRFLYEIRHLTGINVDFVVQLVKLIRVMVPRVASAEVLLLILHTMSLISRTFLSVYVASLEGRVVKFIVRRDIQQFALLMCKWLLIAVPATFLNSLIRFLESKLALAFRSRLVTYAYHMYFRNETYYSVSNLDTRLENVDHSLTDDITTFAHHCAHMYSHVTKPLLDVAVVLLTLFRMGQQMGSYGTPGPLLGTSIVFCTHLILRRCSPQFGKLVSEEARRKGYLRFIHSRIITNAEEIAFYRGGHIERAILQRAYRSLTNQMNVIFNQRLWYVMLEQLLMKYLWSATGMVVIATPIMLMARESPGQCREEDISDRTEYMMTAKNILISGSDAMERLLSSYKELNELVGYTNRVARMFTVFEEAGRGQFKRDSVVSKSLPVKGNGQNCQILAPVIHYVDGTPQVNGVVVEVENHIRLARVPIVTPNCDVVVPSLSLTVKPSMHLLITGPNGCGKSSLFRILAGLWPVFGGRLERPSTDQMFYIPQRPYMSLGTLRDQLIYPDTADLAKRKGFSDQDLEHILDLVYLRPVISREGGWEARGDWKDILSGGEKQRMGMARLFYHRFALLDECTSAVSIDVEAQIYQTAKDLNISLITITHRPSLWRFHTHLLQFDGEGGWRVEPLDTSCRLSLREEKEKLEQDLSGVPLMQSRLKELCGLLAEDCPLSLQADSTLDELAN